jgi:hypothetical protein
MISNNFKQNIDETHSKQPNVGISIKKTIPKGTDLKIYSPAYGFLIFVISFSGRSRLRGPLAILIISTPI